MPVKIFLRRQKNAPCIVFIDEIDALPDREVQDLAVDMTSVSRL
ncbi:MAG: AAA family ATPase [Coprococcus sp.]